MSSISLMCVINSLGMVEGTCDEVMSSFNADLDGKAVGPRQNVSHI